MFEDNYAISNGKQRRRFRFLIYSIILVPFIKEMHYPLPFFIHRDDKEYGLRANGQFIFLNGITIWHEAFENKLPGFLEYYDVRNLAITNAIQIRSLLQRISKRCFLCRSAVISENTDINM